jgi:4-amino-4-deoxychorismate lyase
MLWDGAVLARRALHGARMARGAAALGWPFDPAAFDAALTGLPATPARIRLTAGRSGALQAEVQPLPPAKPVWCVALAPARLSSSDPWLRLKTTRRPAYDAARAALPPDIDELIFLNERDEVCDGTITTIFFDRGQGMRTPPLSSGLLPGVLRESLTCPEELLRAEDLPHVRLWAGNSLRGLIPAVWAG